MPNKKEFGFTLVEILVTISIFALIAAFSVFASFDYYRSYALRSERYNLVSLLQKARGQAQANINQQKHGIHFDSGGFTLFEGNAYVAGAPSNAFFSSNGIVTHSGPSDIIFDQLTAGTSGGNITLHDGTHPDVIISINNEAKISY